MPTLSVVGARQHNLKNINCDLPRNRLVVVTGPSGCGKSSLAFDTIYAEGQRRYVESLSAYARQFLDRHPKPQVDSIEGLSPAVAIEQRPLTKNARSTVGTVTEISDYLRLLFSRAGTPHCPISGVILRAHTVQEMTDLILGKPEGTKLMLLAPIVRGPVQDLTGELQRLRAEGFVRVRLDAKLIDLSDPSPPQKAQRDLQVVVDRLIVKEGIKGRLTDSIELCLRLGDGTMMVDFLNNKPPLVLSQKLVSWDHGVTLPPLEPRLFSFNNPHGACPECGGLGVSSQIDEHRVISDPERSLRQGAIAAFGARGSLAAATAIAELIKKTGVDPDVPWESLPELDRALVLNGGSGSRSKKKSYEGVIPRLTRLLGNGLDDEREPPDDGAPNESELAQFRTTMTCPLCEGSRLRREALSVKVGGHTIADFCDWPLARLKTFIEKLPAAHTLEPRALEVAKPLLGAVSERLGFLVQIGLDYLSLSRASSTLSGGEGQRIRLATQIGAALVGVLYVLDEPSVGLHSKDNVQLLAALRRLVEKGNSVLLVEHDREAILAADYLLDMGPGAGEHGGTILARGTPNEVLSSPESVTAPYLDGRKYLARPKRKLAPQGNWLEIKGARAHNLKSVDCKIPLALLTVVTGVSGSGKSSLIVKTLLNQVQSTLHGSTKTVGPCDDVLGIERLDKVLSIGQSPIGRTPRSNAATYTGIFSLLRSLYSTLPEARARGYKAGRFSFNVKGGRCEGCQGDGVERVAMHFLPDVYVECDACSGQRYNRETLEVRYRGLSIAAALELTVDHASELFDSVPKISRILGALRRVGLGYLKLGQSATTLSGGEAQRLKLAAELAKTATGSTLYVLDEPTTGLHFTDIELLIDTLLDLRDAGNTIVVIEHNLDLITCADWIVDVGPEGGDRGGKIVASGPPEQVALQATHTGRALNEHLAQHSYTALKSTPRSKR